MLDADEYLHLAINSSQAGDHHAALEHLHKALEKEPAHVGARYFLAAEHAELGLFERACAEMQELLMVAPELDIARFQLGLLSLQLDRKESALQAFAALVESARDESLQSFARAYLSLLEDRKDDAIEQLEQGLRDCGNPALKGDMSRVLAGLKQEAPPVTDDSGEVASPVFLGAYRNSDETP
ncbi:tetratricopeptide repeat protein [Pseudomonas sp. CAU 1711]|uniref:tetratricopeptide repeat protein n=1 Tax=Pseudomonas sp. CAU 1711 TaxID=3140356 RepID=UPI003261A477